MGETENTQPSKKYAIHPNTRLGTVSLTVNSIDRQLAFYEKVLGLQLHWWEGDQAGLGVGGEDLLHLLERPEAQRARGTTGIYHFALRLPNRKELARVIARLFRLGYPNYPTDHVTSKTTYLDDAEGNNIEIYIYSLEEGIMTTENGELVVKRTDGRLSSGREPLDVESLFRELAPEDNLNAALPAETVMGHIHLYGNDLQRSMEFYRDLLGFKEGLMSTGFRMADVGLDRPHVIAFNTWQGHNAPPAPNNTLGLRYFTIVLPDQAEVSKVLARLHQAGIESYPQEGGYLVRDPAQIPMIIKAVKIMNNQ